MLVVKEIPVSNAKHPKLKHNVLPKHEFTMALVAPKGSGKTTLLVNLLDFYSNFFHRIIIFSPTINNDEKWEYIKNKKILVENVELKKALEKIKKKGGEIVSGEPVPNLPSFNPKMAETCFVTEFTEEDISNIHKQQQDMIEFLKKHGYTRFVADRVLLLFDDLVGSSLYSRAQNAPFKVLNSNHRHESISMLMVTQAYKEIPKTIRTNFTCLILFTIHNEQEIRVIFEEYPMGLVDFEAWKSVYKYCTLDPHAFMFYDTLKPAGKRVMRNFLKYVNVGNPAKRIKLYE